MVNGEVKARDISRYLSGIKVYFDTTDTKSRGLRNVIASFLILDGIRNRLTKQSLNDLINNEKGLAETFDDEIKVQDKLEKIIEQMNRLYDNLSKKSELLKEVFFGHNIEQHKHSDPEIYKEFSEYLYTNLKSEQTYFECCNKIKSKFPDVELTEFNDSGMFELYATSYNHNSIFKDLVDKDETIGDMKKKYSL